MVITVLGRFMVSKNRQHEIDLHRNWCLVKLFDILSPSSQKTLTASIKLAILKPLIFHWTYAPTTTSCSLFSQRLFYFPICRQREAGKGLSDSRKMSRPNYAKILFQTLPPVLGTSHVRSVKNTSLGIRVLGVRFPTVLYNAIETTRREATSKHRLVVKASTGIECLLF